MAPQNSTLLHNNSEPSNELSHYSPIPKEPYCIEICINNTYSDEIIRPMKSMSKTDQAIYEQVKIKWDWNVNNQFCISHLNDFFLLVFHGYLNIQLLYFEYKYINVSKISKYTEQNRKKNNEENTLFNSIELLIDSIISTPTNKICIWWGMKHI